MVRNLRFISLGLFTGKAPDGFTIDVKCGNPRCFLPAHCILRGDKRFTAGGSARREESDLDPLFFRHDDLSPAREPKCSLRGCPYPSLHDGLCWHHLVEIPLDRGVLPDEDLFDTKEGEARMTTTFANRERVDFLYSYLDGYPDKTPAERMNDRWWFENVTLKRIPTPGILSRNVA